MAVDHVLFGPRLQLSHRQLTWIIAKSALKLFNLSLGGVSLQLKVTGTRRLQLAVEFWGNVRYPQATGY